MGLESESPFAYYRSPSRRPTVSPSRWRADMRNAQDSPNIPSSTPKLTVVQHTHSLRESVVNRVLLARRQLVAAGHDHHVRVLLHSLFAPQITSPRPCVHSWLCSATTTPHYPRSAPRCQSLRLSTSSAYFNGTSRRLCLPLAARQATSRRRTQPGRRASPLGRIASPKPRPASSRVMALCGVQLED